MNLSQAQRAGSLVAKKYEEDIKPQRGDIFFSGKGAKMKEAKKYQTVGPMGLAS